MMIPHLSASKNPFRYVPPSRESISDKGKGAMRNKGTIKSFFVPFKPPTMHELRGSFLQREISNIDDYLKEFKNS